MRISVYSVALGLTFAAVIAGPLVPSEVMDDFWHTPSASGVTQIKDTIGRTLSMAAFADETDAQPIDFDKLIRVDDQEFQVSANDSVSTDVLFASQVKKIGYGVVQTVNIVRTPSGTYSSDALVSPHILYPGVDVSKVPAELANNSLSLFSQFGWTALKTIPAGSTISMGTSGGGGTYIADNFGTCFTGVGYNTCS